MRSRWLFGLVLSIVALFACREFRFVGVRCGAGIGTCPENLECRVPEDSPDAGTFCLVPIGAASDAGGGGGSDSGTDAGTAAGVWSDAGVVVKDSDGIVSSPVVGLDSAGNAIVVWNRGSSTSGTVLASRFVRTLGNWGAPAVLSQTSVSALTQPEVAVSNGGEAVVIWTQDAGTKADLWFNRFTLDSGAWGLPVGNIDGNSTDHVKTPQLAGDPEGNAMVIWGQGTTGKPEIWSRRYNAATASWEDVKKVDSASAITVGSYTPMIALNSAGHGAAVWYGGSGSDARAYANRYNRDAGTWGSVVTLGLDAGGSYNQAVAISPSGDILAVWTQTDAGTNQIWYRRYVAGSQEWSDAGYFRYVGGNLGGFKVQPSGDGGYFAAWLEASGTRLDAVAAEFDGVAGTWGSVIPLETGDMGGAQSLSLAVDGNGRAFASYALFNGATYEVWVNRCGPAADGGCPPERLSVTSDKTALTPRVATNPSGRAALVWNQFDVAGDAGAIWARFFD